MRHSINMAWWQYILVVQQQYAIVIEHVTHISRWFGVRQYNVITVGIMQYISNMMFHRNDSYNCTIQRDWFLYDSTEHHGWVW